MAIDVDTNLRTFIAVEIPAATRFYVSRRQEHMRAYLERQSLAWCFRWTDADSLHLTLRFLGETTIAQRTQLARDLPSAARAWQPVDLYVGGIGCFPSFRRPNVVWIGIEGMVAELHTIQAEVERLVQATGFAAETRSFSPHLTVGRARRGISSRDLQQTGQALQRYVSEGVQTDAGGNTTWFTVDHIVHMRSDLRPSGSIYTPLTDVPFG